MVEYKEFSCRFIGGPKDGLYKDLSQVEFKELSAIGNIAFEHASGRRALYTAIPEDEEIGGITSKPNHLRFIFIGYPIK